MNMNQIQYFEHSSRMHFAAVVPGRYAETICFYDVSNYNAACIDFKKGGHHSVSYYELVENDYSPCSYETYVEARLQALASLVGFFGDAEEFTTPRPEFVERAGRLIPNDLPF